MRIKAIRSVHTSDVEGGILTEGAVVDLPYGAALHLIGAGSAVATDEDLTPLDQEKPAESPAAIVENSETQSPS